MTELLEALREAYREGGVKGLASEAERMMPPSADPCGGQGWVDELIAGCTDPEYSVPSSWLLLQHVRRGHPIPAASVERLTQACLTVGPEGAQLHLAQLVQHLDIPNGSAEALAEFLTDSTSSRHTFLRAWGVDGLYRLSLQHPEYGELAERALEAAAGDPRASVRARVRRIEAEKKRRA